MREVLASRPFAQILEAQGIAVERVSEPKQTDTTQRWKIGLRVEGVGAELPTKLECSRRGIEEGVAIGSVDPAVAATYRLPPFLISHYDTAAALRQMIGALAGRRETQARDVFDLHHLLAGGASLRGRTGPARGVAERARENALSVDFDTFRSQVLSYIEPDARAQYDSPAAWDTIVLEVVEGLRRERRFDTPFGAVSLHHVRPSFFFGYEEAGRAGGRLATPEKALLDFLYLAPTRSRLFRALPELEWPKSFKAGVARSVASRIEPASRRRAVVRKLEELLATRRRR